jgi:WD40 repeat protein
MPTVLFQWLADHDGGVLLVDPETGKIICTLKSKGRGATALLFSRDGKTLFKRLPGVAVGEWDVTTGKPRRYLGTKAPKSQDQISMPGAPLALSPDGLTLAVCGVDNRIHFFDLATGMEKSFGGHADAVDRLHFAADRKRLWTSDIGNTLCLWEIPTAKELPPPSFPAENLGTHISSDGRFAIQRKPFFEGFTAFDLIARQETSLKWPLPHPPYDQHELALAPDGKTLAIRWFEGQRLELYEMPSLQLRHTLAISTGVVKRGLILPNSQANGLMIFSHDSRLLTAYSDPKTLAVWNTATGQKTASFSLPTGDFALNGAFSRDGRSLALDYEDGTVLLVELATAQVRRSYGVKATPAEGTHLHGFFSESGSPLAQSAKVAMTPDGKLLVHGGPDKVVRVYNVFTGEELARYTGHEGAILAVAISNDGKYAATASTDTTVLVWELPAASHGGGTGK